MMPNTQLSDAAKRMRHYRRRRRDRARHMCGDVPVDIVRALVRSDWLGSGEADNPRKLGAALVDLADCWTHGTLKPPKP